MSRRSFLTSRQISLWLNMGNYRNQLKSTDCSQMETEELVYFLHLNIKCQPYCLDRQVGSRLRPLQWMFGSKAAKEEYRVSWEGKLSELVQFSWGKLRGDYFHLPELRRQGPTWLFRTPPPSPRRLHLGEIYLPHYHWKTLTNRWKFFCQILLHWYRFAKRNAWELSRVPTAWKDTQEMCRKLRKI
jgi:hypothetical protein